MKIRSSPNNDLTVYRPRTHSGDEWRQLPAEKQSKEEGSWRRAGRFRPADDMGAASAPITSVLSAFPLPEVVPFCSALVGNFWSALDSFSGCVRFGHDHGRRQVLSSSSGRQRLPGSKYLEEPSIGFHNHWFTAANRGSVCFDATLLIVPSGIPVAMIAPQSLSYSWRSAAFARKGFASNLALAVFLLSLIPARGADEKIQLRWLDSKPAAATGVTWGVPWPKGTFSK
ncbi:MAG: hypothetical protein ACK5YZ_01460, partial [bacterium]